MQFMGIYYLEGMEVVQFCRAAHESGIRRALVVVLSTDHPPLPRQQLVTKVWEEYGVLTTMTESVYELLFGALSWTIDPLETALVLIPAKVVD